MQISLEPKIELRSKIARIAAAVGLALVIGSFGVGSASAADNHAAATITAAISITITAIMAAATAAPPSFTRSRTITTRRSRTTTRQPEPYNYYGDSPQYPVAPPQGVLALLRTLIAPPRAVVS